MAAVTDLVIDQNSDFLITVSLTNANGTPLILSGYTFQGTIKKSFDSDVEYSMNVFTSNTLTGNVSISLAAANSALIDPGKYLYGVNISSETSNVRILEGTVVITPSVV